MTKAVALDETGITRPFRVDDVPWEEFSKGARFMLRYRPLTDYAGGAKIGVSYEELPAGKQSVPFHYHYVEEEHMYFLEGRATLRLGEKSYEVKAGDYVCFPAGQAAGHCLINTSDAACRFLTIGGRDANEICVYPDSDKISIRPMGAERIRIGARVDYWDGEKTDEAV